MSWAISHDGTEIYYDIQGTGPTLLFVSGFMGISDIWHSVCERLTTKFRCIVVDNRGYGRSGKPAEQNAYSILNHASDLEAVINAANLTEKIVLVSHSMGGHIASELYFKRSSQIAGIAYLGSYLSTDSLIELGQTGESLAAGVKSHAQRVEFYMNFGLPEHLALEATKWPYHSLVGNAHGLIQSKVGKRYGEIAVPALVIHGDNDVVDPLEECAIPIVNAIPGAHLEVLPHVNHFPAVEAPGPVSALLERHAYKCFGI